MRRACLDSSNEIRDTKSSYTLEYAELGSNQQQALRHSFTRISHLPLNNKAEHVPGLFGRNQINKYLIY